MSYRYDRRAFLRRGIGLAAGGALLPGAAAAFLEACGGQSSPSSAGGPPRRGGTLVFGTEAEITGFDPRQNIWDSSGVLYARAVYDPLFTQAADGTVKPYLAESIAPNADYTEWTITVRRGITFHDGSPLDAQAVKLNLDAAVQSPLGQTALFDIAGTTVLDPLRVLVQLRTPWVPFPYYLTAQPGFQLGVKQLADTSGRSKPIGTGPFVFKEWIPGDHFTATRNPNYWRQGLPYLDAITFRPLPDPRSRENALRAGDIDVMHSADTQNVANLVHDSGFIQINDLENTLGEPSQDFVMLNTAVPPLNDLRVRQALAYATDRQRYIDTLGNGLTKPSEGPYVKGSPYYVPTGYPGYDPRRARALVADYEREKGPVTFKYGNVSTAKGRQQNELMQAMWRQVGIQADIVQVEQAPYIVNAVNGNYQAYGWRQFGVVDPDGNYLAWSGSTAAPVGKQALNFARNRDAQIDAALQAGRTQVDPTVRAAAYRLIGVRLATDIPYIWLCPTVWMVAARRSVGGLGAGHLPDGGPARSMVAGIIATAELWKRA